MLGRRRTLSVSSPAQDNENLRTLMSATGARASGPSPFGNPILLDADAIENAFALARSSDPPISAFGVKHLTGLIALTHNEGLIQRYMEALAEKVENGGTMHVELLRGIRRILQNEDKVTSAGQADQSLEFSTAVSKAEVAEAMVSGGVVRAVISVLNVSAGEQTTAEGATTYILLCQEILKTLTSIAQTPVGSNSLLASDAYRILYESLLLSFGNGLPSSLLDSLFAMLLGHQTLSLDDVENAGLVIENPQLLSAIMGFFPTLQNDDQLTTIQRLTRIAESKEWNRWVLCQNSVPLGFLKLVTQGFGEFTSGNADGSPPYPTSVQPSAFVWKAASLTMQFIEICWSYSIRISEAKTILSMLSVSSPRDQKSNRTSGPQVLPYYHAPLLRALNTMSQKDNTSSFFQFSGQESGIILRPASVWEGPLNDNGSSDRTGSTSAFPTAGFTFLTWIRCESFKSFPRLLSFLTPTSHGMEAYFQPSGSLTFRVHRPGHDPREVSMTKFKFSLRRWYFVAITHVPSRRGWGFGSPEIALHVDGEVCCKTRLDYPTHLTGLTNCAIGALVSPRSGKTKYRPASSKGSMLRRDVQLTCCFSGQMTSIYIIEDMLSTAQINAICALGRNSGTQFSAEEFGRREIGGGKEIVSSGKGSSNIALLVDNGVLHGRILLHLHVKACGKDGGEGCMNLAPRKMGRTDSSVMDATLCNVRPSETLGLATAIHHIGGLEVLFPLIHRFDKKIISSPSSSPIITAQEEDSDLFTSSTAGPLHPFVTLISSLLRNNSQNQEALLKSRGIHVLSFLLQQADPRHITVQGYRSLVGLTHAVSSNEELTSRVYEQLMFNFALWIYASIETQRYCLEFLRNFTDSRSTFCRSRFGVQYFLDALRLYYWYVPSEWSAPEKHLSLSGNRTTSPYPPSGSPTAQRPSKEEIGTLRGMVIGTILKGYVSLQIRPDETGAILRAMAKSNDPEHTCELLEFLLDLMVHCPKCGIADQLLMQNGWEVILDLICQSRNADVQSWSIRILLFLSTSGKVNGRWQRRLKLNDMDLGVIVRLFEGTTFTYGLYRSLLDFATEMFEYESEKSPRLDSGTRNDEAIVKNPKMLVVIFAVLAQSPATSATERVRILNEMKGICSETNIAELGKISGWMRYVLANVILPEKITTNRIIPECLAKSPDATRSTPQIHDTTNEDIDLLRDILTDILVAGLWSSIQSDKNAWKLVEEAVVQAYLLHGQCGCLKIVTGLFFILLNNFRCFLADREANSTTMDNILRIVLLIDEFLFNHEDIFDALKARKETNVASDGVFALFDGSRSNSAILARSPSNPWEDCCELAETYLSTVQLLDEMNAVHTTPDGIELKSNGLCRITFRMLTSAISYWKDEIGPLVPYLTGFIARHFSGVGSEPVKSSCEDVRFVRKIMMPLCGYLHEAAMMTTPDSKDDGLHSAYVSTLRCCYKHLRSVPGPALPIDISWIDRCNTELSFSRFVNSAEWQSVYDNYLIPAMKSLEEEEISRVPTFVNRYGKTGKAILARARKDEASQMKAEQAMELSIRDSVQTLKDEERERMCALDEEHKNEYFRTIRQWLAKYLEVTRERGPWFVAEQEAVRWKLDRTENHDRMRRKLCVNSEFDELKFRVASAKRDRISQDPSPKGQKQYGLERLKKNSQLERTNSQSSFQELLGEIVSPCFSLIPLEDLNLDAADEENCDWNLVGEDVTIGAGAANQEGKVIYTNVCEMVVLLTAIHGRIELTSSALCFHVDRKSIVAELGKEASSMIVDSDMLRNRKWALSDIREVHFRRYMLRKSALEIFLTDGTTAFLNFPTDLRERLRFHGKLLSLRPSALGNHEMRPPADMLRRSDLTQRWQKHEISNFEYLMHLNSLAGRSYQDLTQYFVFPWVLLDYESSTIDLSDPKIYRDLTKPVGALNDARLKGFLDRYHAFDDPAGRIPKFHYGTHYSSAASVAYYLIRMEPFTSIHIALHGGKFDHADRQFHSIAQCWQSCLTNPGDVKELTPEFFYCPEFLVNSNGFDLGVQQSGVKLGDVVLPPWAESPEHFVKIQRQALESDYVSENLHHWIDLIFGYQQKGEEAIKAHNLFYYLTYEGTVNIDSIQDPVERSSVEAQIYHFGQTPGQLLMKPHPKRFPRANYTVDTLFTNPRTHTSFLMQMRSHQLYYVAMAHTVTNISFTSLHSQQLITVDGEGLVGIHQWSSTRSSTSLPFTAEIDPTLPSKRRISSAFCADLTITPRLFACTDDGRYVLSAGHWDCTWKIILAESGRILTSVSGHSDIVTCLALSEDGRTVVTGSRSSTLATWEVIQTGNSSFGVKSKPRTVMYGHDDAVTTVALNAEHDIVVSGSKDNTCIIHALRTGAYVRTLRSSLESEGTAEIVRITKYGCIVVYSEFAQSAAQLHIYSVNGKLLCETALSERCTDMVVSASGEWLITSGTAGGVKIYDTFGLDVLYDFDMAPAHSVCLDDAERFLLLGCDAGQLYAVTFGK